MMVLTAPLKIGYRSAEYKNGSYTVTVSGFAIALLDSKFRLHSPFSFKAPVFELLRGRF